ncbi:hypothetical protein SCLCIDRAFT_448450 [Scleroderma citrinum Foug A]|uniref:Uncharacterized protein n=1 Tax=Scleroderma citrinum Foug A TaxID=1036808 RepID=A0A0C2YUL4_9AGAM|nr:hypothetical protein SCLCIDRAFT_448450 [Scleroderma citrinum Foug A]
MHVKSKKAECWVHLGSPPQNVPPSRTELPNYRLPALIIITNVIPENIWDIHHARYGYSPSYIGAFCCSEDNVELLASGSSRICSESFDPALHCRKPLRRGSRRISIGSSRSVSTGTTTTTPPTRSGPHVGHAALFMTVNGCHLNQ